MRKNVDYLSKVAHDSFIDGLKKTGLEVDTIPNMYGMNRILKEIGWAAVAVDGFITDDQSFDLTSIKYVFSVK